MQTPCQCESAELNGGHRIQKGSGAAMITILDRRSFTFTPLKVSVGMPSTMDVILCPAVCVLEYYRVRLEVRVHAISLTDAAQTLEFLAFGAMPSDEDPSLDFINPTSFISLPIDSQTQAPRLLSASGSDPDPYLRILLRATQGSAVVTFSAVLSACLVLRDSGSGR